MIPFSDTCANLRPQAHQTARRWFSTYSALDLLKRRGLWLAEIEMDKFGFKRLAAPRILEIEAELIARGINFDMPRVPEKYDTGFIYLDLDSAADTRN